MRSRLRMLSRAATRLAALRTYYDSEPLQGQYASADFLLLLGDNRAEDVRFLKGDEELKKADASTPGSYLSCAAADRVEGEGAATWHPDVHDGIEDMPAGAAAGAGSADGLASLLTDGSMRTTATVIAKQQCRAFWRSPAHCSPDCVPA